MSGGEEHSVGREGVDPGILEFQAELIKTHAAPTKERDNLLGVDGMDLDEFHNSLLTNGNNENEDGVVNVEEEKQSDDAEAKTLVAGDTVMKQGARKWLFKPSTITGGSTKMKMYQALISPRKRTVAKTGTLQGDNSKQVEDKGISNPKPGLPKP
ncbi:hypothetical protein IGI04_018770 [Brassica rapa subsp. trilocularis]|uniref:Uncharacterized protein n=1 Tax=Brassica rapa subsp. trilocularis TaxID=1813537 RepID=A0ABQ7MGC3_BRACM|nr:hypothetical protein IGI04_018770 [Brassica rapa subsp. trilocularis]